MAAEKCAGKLNGFHCEEPLDVPNAATSVRAAFLHDLRLQVAVSISG